MGGHWELGHHCLAPGRFFTAWLLVSLELKKCVQRNINLEKYCNLYVGYRKSIENRYKVQMFGLYKIYSKNPEEDSASSKSIFLFFELASFFVAIVKFSLVLGWDETAKTRGFAMEWTLSVLKDEVMRWHTKLGISSTKMVVWKCLTNTTVWYLLDLTWFDHVTKRLRNECMACLVVTVCISIFSRY